MCGLPLLHGLLGCVVDLFWIPTLCGLHTMCVLPVLCYLQLLCSVHELNGSHLVFGPPTMPSTCIMQPACIKWSAYIMQSTCVVHQYYGLSVSCESTSVAYACLPVLSTCVMWSKCRVKYTSNCVVFLHCVVYQVRYTCVM